MKKTVLVLFLVLLGLNVVIASESKGKQDCPQEISQSENTIIHPNSSDDKDQIFTFFLALLFGLWGFHRFYLGLNKSAWIKMLTTIIWYVVYSSTLISGAGILFPIISAIVGIWYFLDLISVLTGFLSPEYGNYK